MHPAWRLPHQPSRTTRWCCRSFLGTTLQLSYCAPLTHLFLHVLSSLRSKTMLIGHQDYNFCMLCIGSGLQKASTHHGASSAQAPSTDFSFNTNAKPKVMTSEPTSNTGALGKSPVYSPLGSSAHEVRVTLNPNPLLVTLGTMSSPAGNAEAS